MNGLKNCEREPTMIDTSKFQKLEKEDIACVNGGYDLGNRPTSGVAPGTKCPICRDLVVISDKPMKDGYLRYSYCFNCDKDWPWYYIDENPDRAYE